MLHTQNINNSKFGSEINLDIRFVNKVVHAMLSTDNVDSTLFIIIDAKFSFSVEIK